jgi:enterobactin synthetase component D / holo-[acyl-carrier protein] synthase
MPTVGPRICRSNLPHGLSIEELKDSPVGAIASTTSPLRISGSSLPRSADVEAISRLFPADVAVCIASPGMYRGGLFPEEAELIAASSPKRRAEFTAGRNAARAALARMKAPMRPILSGPQRAPLWPSGFVGSITHCDEFCCAVVARSSQIGSLGLDAETIDPLEDALAKLICDPDEFVHFSNLPESPGTNWAKLAFSAKEAFHKCHNPLTGELLDFQDVSVRFSLGPTRREGSFEIIIGHRGASPAQDPSINGAWLIDEKRVYAGACCLS